MESLMYTVYVASIFLIDRKGVKGAEDKERAIWWDLKYGTFLLFSINWKNIDILKISLEMF